MKAKTKKVVTNKKGTTKSKNISGKRYDRLSNRSFNQLDKGKKVKLLEKEGIHSPSAGIFGSAPGKTAVGEIKKLGKGIGGRKVKFTKEDDVYDSKGYRKSKPKKDGASMNVPVDLKVNGNPVGNEEQNNDGASGPLGMLTMFGAIKKRNQGKDGEDLRNRKAKKRSDRKKYGWGKKGAAAKKAAIAKKAAEASLAKLGADDGSTGTDGKGPTISSVGDKAVGDLGASMNNTNMSVPAKKIMSIQKMSQGTRPKYDNVQGSSMYEKNKMGASMYRKNMDGSSMNAYQDKEASMDDYSHEKKLKADGRYEAAKGDMSNAKNDFDHAHALKNDAKHDAKGRHSIMKHMRGFK